MTYKEIINRFRNVTESHKMLQDFGYGQLSDLKTQSQLGPEEDGVDYPYLFLLPGTSNRQGPVMNYSFNMIVMDMARGEEGDVYDNYVTIQSQCQQYIDDVLAHLYYYYKDQPEITLTGINYTPFKESYQDELAGMTASITIQVPTPLNECIAPFDPIFNISDVHVTFAGSQIVGPDSGETNVISALNTPVPSGVSGYWDSNRFYSAGGRQVKIVVTGNIRAIPGVGTVPLPFKIRQIPGFIDTPATSVSYWPTAASTTLIPFEIIWNDYTLPASGTLDLISLLDEPGDELELELTDINIRYYIA